MPFSETIGRLLKSDCDITLYPNRNFFTGYWCYFRTEDEYLLFEKWKKLQGTRVFLRDCLDLSVALGMNIVVGDGGLEGYTHLGRLETRAKMAQDEDAIEELAGTFAETILSLPGYRDAKLVAAVPPHPGKRYDLPSVLAARLAAALSLIDVTGHFSFAREKGSVKESRVADKWAVWEHAGLTFSRSMPSRPKVIVIDDKYQSGVSIQYASSVLRSAGAGEIFGMCAVKTLRACLRMLLQRPSDARLLCSLGKTGFARAHDPRGRSAPVLANARRAASFDASGSPQRILKRALSDTDNA